MVKRFDVYLVNLDERPSRDAKNTRPAVVISPDEMNRHTGHVIIAPVSSPTGKYPTRIPIKLFDAERTIVLDQLRVVDKERLVKHIGEIAKPIRKPILDRLTEFFAE